MLLKKIKKINIKSYRYYDKVYKTVEREKKNGMISKFSHTEEFVENFNTIKIDRDLEIDYYDRESFRELEKYLSEKNINNYKSCLSDLLTYVKNIYLQKKNISEVKVRKLVQSFIKKLQYCPVKIYKKRAKPFVYLKLAKPKVYIDKDLAQCEKVRYLPS